MKVRIRDLDKDLRLMGVLAKLFLSSPPKRKKTTIRNSQTSKQSEINQEKKSPNSRFVSRGDGTELR
ncbi:MAG TPA: hypothetical protein VN441_00520, partial [Syntrophomonas sp.]|nr:hypothetical protein [Syntrophomonas sp.]